jgi:hypothetical protein
MLQIISKQFQWLSRTVGSSMQHDCDIEGRLSHGGRIVHTLP